MVLLLQIAPLVFGTALGLVLALFLARHQKAPGAQPLMAMLLGAGVWSLSYALEIASPDLPTKLLWAKVQYLGIGSLPLAWLVFTASYLGTPRWLARPATWAALAGIPALTVALAWTNEAHGLIWRETWIEQIGAVPMLAMEHGPWFWVYVAYGYSLILAGSIQLATGLLNSVWLHRRQIQLALAAILVPWVGNLVYLSGWGPMPHVDATPFAFTVAGLLLTVSLFHFRLVTIVPIAQKSVFEGLADCVVVLDRGDCLVDLNPAAQEQFGRPAPEAFGRPIAQALPALAALLPPAEQAAAFPVELALGAGAERRVFDLHLSPLAGRQGVAVGRLVVLHDITQHKQDQVLLEQARAHLESTIAERTEALRQAVAQLERELTQRALAEKRFEDVIEAAPDAMLLVDHEARLRLVNRQAEALFGYTRSELLGQDLDVLIPALQRDVHRRRVREYLTRPLIRQVSIELDLQAQRRDGDLFPVEVSLGPLQTEEGQWVACAVRDISERKRAELALQESAQTYRVLFENAGDAILLIGLDGAIQRANQKAADLLGYTRAGLEAMTAFDISVPSEHADVTEKMQRALQGETLPPFVRYYRNRAGGVFPVEINMAPIHHPDGRPRLFQHIVRDITERTKAEAAQRRLLAELQQSQAELQALTARLLEVREDERRQIAMELHDRVGQNLTGLNLNLQIIQNQLNSAASPAVRGRLVDSLSLVEATTRQLRDVMADLHPPELDAFGLVAALRWYCGSFAERTGIETAVIGDELEPRLEVGTETVLFRLAQEALNNVAKHARAAHATVRVEAANGSASLTVEDDGLGFDPAGLSGAAGQAHWGVLNMQQRAAAVGGRLAIESVPGRGSRVRVTLPREGAR